MEHPKRARRIARAAMAGVAAAAIGLGIGPASGWGEDDKDPMSIFDDAEPGSTDVIQDQIEAQLEQAEEARDDEGPPADQRSPPIRASDQGPPKT